MSSSELYLLYSLRGSPVPLGGRLELLSLGGGLDAAVVEWALEEAGPGLAFAPLVGAVEVVLGPCGGCGRPPLAAWALSPGAFVCAAAVADAALVGAGSPPLAGPKPEVIDVSV
jgi:hypothetical protein